MTDAASNITDQMQAKLAALSQVLGMTGATDARIFKNLADLVALTNALKALSPAKAKEAPKPAPVTKAQEAPKVAAKPTAKF